MYDQNYAPIKSKLQHPYLLSEARAFELFKIGSFKFPAPRAKMVFKCPTLSSDLSVKCPPSLRTIVVGRLLSSVIKLVYKHANTFRGPLDDDAVFYHTSVTAKTQL